MKKRNISPILKRIAKDLEQAVVDTRKENAMKIYKRKTKFDPKRYFRGDIGYLGASVGRCKQIGKNYFAQLKKEGFEYKQFMQLAEELLKDNTIESGVIAFAMVRKLEKQFDWSTFKILERWVNTYVNNWAWCDEISTHLIGVIIDRFPAVQDDLLEWTRSKNKWVRRAAAVSYVAHGRHGKYHNQIFKTVERLMEDEDDMVQKGVGWALKETSKTDEASVVKFLMKWRTRSARLLLRYATEKMKPANRKLILAS